MNLRLPIVLAASALLAACGGDNAQREEGGVGEAEGEVLGGSISDEMLPLDTIKSQSPPLKESSASSEGGETAVEEGDAAEAAGSAEQAQPASSESPGDEG